MPHEQEFDVSNIEEEPLEDDDDNSPPEPEPATPVAVAGDKRRRGRAPKKGNAGLGAPARPVFRYQEAELLWVEVLNYLPSVGKSAYDVGIRVFKLSPEKAMVGTAFDGSSVMGNEGQSPSDALVDRVIDDYHLPCSPGPMRYDLTFFWKVGGVIITRGTLVLQAPAEILALRRARMMNAQPKLPGMGVGAPYGQPQQQYSQPAQHHYYPQPQQAAPQPPPSNDYLLGVLSEALAAAREGRAPIISPPPPPAPPPSLP